MTNPFAPAAAPAADNPFGGATVPGAVTTDPNPATPAFSAPAAPAAPAAKPDLSIGGDPFANPTGVGDGEWITSFVGRLLLVKPTEFMSQMNTKQGIQDAVRVDMLVLDDPEQPCRRVNGVLLFQQALRREANEVLTNPLKHYLLGRLSKNSIGNNKTLYTFDEATDDEKAKVSAYIKANPTAL